jgi:hypothetical protein
MIAMEFFVFKPHSTKGRKKSVHTITKQRILVIYAHCMHECFIALLSHLVA